MGCQEGAAALRHVLPRRAGGWRKALDFPARPSAAAAQLQSNGKMRKGTLHPLTPLQLPGTPGTLQGLGRLQRVVALRDSPLQVDDTACTWAVLALWLLSSNGPLSSSNYKQGCNHCGRLSRGVGSSSGFVLSQGGRWLNLGTVLSTGAEDHLWPLLHEETAVKSYVTRGIQDQTSFWVAAGAGQQDVTSTLVPRTGTPVGEGGLSRQSCGLTSQTEGNGFLRPPGSGA